MAASAQTRGNSKRQRILDAALLVFAEHGVHGTPVPPVAEQAGVAVGTLYRYFENKEALVNAVFRDTKERLRRRLLEGLNPQAGAGELFDRVWERMVGFIRECPEAFRFLELQDHYNYLDQRSREVETAVLAPLGMFLREGQKNGEIRQDLRPDVAIALFWGAIVGLFKADRLGYLQLRKEDVEAARLAWRSALLAGSE